MSSFNACFTNISYSILYVSTFTQQVHIYCGVDTKLTGVTEPNRCEYLFEMTTPAVCTKPDDVSGDESTPHGHTEL